MEHVINRHEVRSTVSRTCAAFNRLRSVRIPRLLCKLLSALIVCGAINFPTPAFASLFTGTYNPTFYFDGNLSANGTPGGLVLTAVNHTVTISNGTGPNDLNLTMSLENQPVSVPLVVSGNLATLSPSFTPSNVDILSFNILSDGNNMALGLVLQHSDGTLAYADAVWQRQAGSATASDLLGNWQVNTMYGNERLSSSSPNTFQPEPAACCDTVTNTGGGYQLAYTFNNTAATLPIALSGNNVSLLSPPETNAIAVYQSFNFTFDSNGHGAVAFMSTELNNPTDVAISLALLSNTMSGGNLPCAASLSSSLSLHIPALTFNGHYYWADLQFTPDLLNATVTNEGAVTDASAYSGCVPATLSPDLTLHIPTVSFNGELYWADLTDSQGQTFTLTGAGPTPVFTNEILDGKTYYFLEKDNGKDTFTFGNGTVTIQPEFSGPPESISYSINTKGQLVLGASTSTLISQTADYLLVQGVNSGGSFVPQAQVCGNSDCTTNTTDLAQFQNSATRLKDWFLANGLWGSQITVDGRILNAPDYPQGIGGWHITNNIFYFDYPTASTHGVDSKAYEIDSNQLYFATDAANASVIRMYFSKAKRDADFPN